MDELPLLKFSHRFDGQIWSTLASPPDDILLLEVRNVDLKQVSFSALNVATNSFLWRGKQLEEPWWVNATGISDGKVVFTIYLDTNNPDKKGALVYAIDDLTLVWWNNDLSVSEISGSIVKGFTSRLGLKPVVLDIHTGREITDVALSTQAANGVMRPVQYAEGMEYFSTVCAFLADRLNLNPVSALEYLQVKDKILISYYVLEDDALANYLLMLDSEGTILLKERLDGPVKGIGLDTFFILNGLLIFVRNKVELVSYKII